MFYMKKKGFISLEYVIVTSIVIAACAFIFVQGFPGYASRLNIGVQSILDVSSGDETIPE